MRWLASHIGTKTGKCILEAEFPNHMQNYIYDVALSFAGEDREYVKQVAATLKSNGLRVFYDEYEQANLWGKELIEHLGNIYENEPEYVIMFVSKAYLIKIWTNHERKSALNRALKSKVEYILPVMLDDTKLPGLHDSVGYMSAKNKTPENICDDFIKKIGGNLNNSIKIRLSNVLPLAVLKIQNKYPKYNIVKVSDDYRFNICVNTSLDIGNCDIEWDFTLEPKPEFTSVLSVINVGVFPVFDIIMETYRFYREIIIFGTGGGWPPKKKRVKSNDYTFKCLIYDAEITLM